MSSVHSRSIKPSARDGDLGPVRLPAEVSRGLAVQAVRLIARAEAMGLIESRAVQPLATPLLQEALRELGAAGIGRELFMTRAAVDEESLTRLNVMVAASPHPLTEWDAISSVLGADLTADLVGVSSSSIRRYAAGMRPTPDPVAHRLHFLAMVVADLKGSYSDYGVRRWFDRPRSAIDGLRPRDVLSDSWTPEDGDVRRVTGLASALVGLNAS